MKTQTTEAVIKVLIVVILIGVVIGISAPFSHIFLPKTAKEKIELKKKYDDNIISEKTYKAEKKLLHEKYKFAGFTNKRRFAFAIGLPISLFICSLIFLYVSSYIAEERIKKASIIAGLSFQFTSIYFIIWVLWALKKGSDFPKSLYYLSIVIMSIAATFFLFYLIKSSQKNVNKIKGLLLFLFEIRNKHFQKVAMRSLEVDEEETISEITIFEKRTKEELQKIAE